MIVISSAQLLPFGLLLAESKVDWDGRYGFAALPRARNVETELGYQILWQPPPACEQQ